MTAKELSHRMLEGYMSDPSRCPFCEASKRTADCITIDSAHAWQTADCESCGASWTDAYRIANADVLRMPSSDMDLFALSVPSERANLILTEQQQEAHNLHAGFCPFCEMPSQAPDRIFAEGSTVMVTSSCPTCGAVWKDNFALEGPVHVNAPTKDYSSLRPGSKTIKAVLIDVGQPPAIIELPKDATQMHKALKRLVGGDIEHYDLPYGAFPSLIINKDGTELGLSPNRAVTARVGRAGRYADEMVFRYDVGTGGLRTVLYGPIVALNHEATQQGELLPADMTPAQINRLNNEFADIESGEREKPGGDLLFFF